MNDTSHAKPLIGDELAFERRIISSIVTRDFVQESKESIQGVVFPTGAEARNHGKGGIWYRWVSNDRRSFPQDVKSVMIVMPVNWGNAGVHERGISAEWTVSEKNVNGAQWSLSGTEDKPTLSPSLHWVGVWHGFLENGFLRSC